MAALSNDPVKGGSDWPLIQRINTQKKKKKKHVTVSIYTTQINNKFKQPTGLRLPTGVITSASYPKPHTTAHLDHTPKHTKSVPQQTLQQHHHHKRSPAPERKSKTNN